MPVIGPLWAWLVGLLGSLVSSLATWFIGRMAVDRAFHYALVTAFLFTCATLFLALTVTVKAAVIGARVAMPDTLGMATFFLPPSTPVMFSTIVTVRVSVALYNWTVTTLAAYLPAWDRMGMRIR